MVAGVLGGLGRRLGVDPALLRVTTVVLAIFGAGIVLYALAWLLIPDEDADASILEQALGRSRAEGDRTRTVLLAGGLAVAALVAAGGVFGDWDGAVLFALAVAGLVLLLRRHDAGPPHEPSARATGAQPSYQESTMSTPPPADADAATGIAPSMDPSATSSGQAGTGQAGGQQDRAAWPTGPDWQDQPAWDSTATGWGSTGSGGPGSAGTDWTYGPPPPPHRPRSALGPLTLSLALLVIGALAALDVTIGVDLPVAGYLAAALGVVGLGLLVGAWYGRSRGLIVLGILLGLAMGPAVVADRYDLRNAEDVVVTVTSVADMDTAKTHSAGRVEYDLTALALTEATPAPPLRVDQGIGELIVTVPPDADVEIDASVGIGEVDAFGRRSGGLGNNNLTFTDVGEDGPGGGTLVLELDLGIGSLEVRRAAA